MSEIGISTENVLKECNILKSTCHLEYFSKQKPQENFAALGNDNGLIIFAKNKRKWFPTNNSSEKHWTKVKFNNNGKTREIEYYFE